MLGGGGRHNEPRHVLLLELPCVFCSLKQVTGPSLSRHRRVPRALQGLNHQERARAGLCLPRAVPGPEGEAAKPVTAPPSRHGSGFPF